MSSSADNSSSTSFDNSSSTSSTTLSVLRHVPIVGLGVKIYERTQHKGEDSSASADGQRSRGSHIPMPIVGPLYRAYKTHEAKKTQDANTKPEIN